MLSRIKLALVTTLTFVFIFPACSQDTVRDEAVAEDPGIPAGSFSLKVQAAWPETLTLYENLTEFAERVETLSAGRLKIEPLPAGAVVPVLEIQDAVDQGVVDGGHTGMGFIADKHRAAIPLSHGPVFGMDTVDMYGWYYEGGGWELIQEWYQDVLGLNVVSFPIGPVGPQAMGWFTEPINSLRDLQGVNYRGYGIGNEVYGRMGVNVVTLPGGDIVPALEKGEIVAAEWVGGIEDLNLGIHKVLKTHYTPGMQEPVSNIELVINKEVYDGLPPDLQSIIRTAADATFIRWWVKFQKQNAQAYSEMAQVNGVDVLRTPDEIMYEFLEVYDEIVKDDSRDPFYEKVIQSQKAYARTVVPYRLSIWPDYDFAGKYFWEEEIYLKGVAQK